MQPAVIEFGRFEEKRAWKLISPVPAAVLQPSIIALDGGQMGRDGWRPYGGALDLDSCTSSLSAFVPKALHAASV